VIRNPVSRVKFLEENNELTQLPSDDDVRNYFAVASQPLYDVASLILETGMRPEEVIHIRRDNVHLAENYYYNPHGKTKAARRRIPLTANAAAVLKHRLETIPGPYIFPHEKDQNKPMLKVNHAHDGAVRRSRVRRFRLYDLRHLFATRLAQAGVDLVTLAALLGHSKIQMVLRYAHPVDSHKVNAIRKLEDYTATRQIEETTRQMDVFTVGNPDTLQ